MYGQGRIIESANEHNRNLNIKGIKAFDLRVQKADGSYWNFSLASDRREAMQYILEFKPTWIIGSPPCTAFSILNHGMNYPKMDPAKVRAMIKEGRSHLRFMIKLYKIQLSGDKHVLHGHPATARKLLDTEMLKLLNTARSRL